MSKISDKHGQSSWKLMKKKVNENQSRDHYKTYVPAYTQVPLPNNMKKQIFSGLVRWFFSFFLCLFLDLFCFLLSLGLYWLTFLILLCNYLKNVGFVVFLALFSLPYLLLLFCCFFNHFNSYYQLANTTIYE